MDDLSLKDDLRLKIRNKIYTSGHHMVDTTSNNNAVIVFLGEMSFENLGSYIEKFLKDTLNHQIDEKKISFVRVNEDGMSKLTEELVKAVQNMTFNPGVINKLFISFVTIMDDGIHKTEPKIEVSEIENLKQNVLVGCAVEIFYDFYGLFVPATEYSNRKKARKMIISFLDTNNGGAHLRKKIYHQACSGNDYYRSAKSITFMILVTLIEKINQHTILDSTVENDSYTWTTFALFEKNLVALVIYEMINKLLANQNNGAESVPIETIESAIRDLLTDKVEKRIEQEKLISVNDPDYLPIIVHKKEQQLSFIDRIRKRNPISFKEEPNDGNLENLLKQQQAIINQDIEDHITKEYLDSEILKLIKSLTAMASIEDNGLIYRSLDSIKKQLLNNEGFNSEFIDKYKAMLAESKAKIVDKLRENFQDQGNDYLGKVQKHWNLMNLEVHRLITEFAEFSQHFAGINDLIANKSINLLSTYDDILEKINMVEVIDKINANANIYSDILHNYYDSIQEAGNIAIRFGSRNILPELGNINYYLFSDSNVNRPNGLKIVNNEYWFKKHEIAILLTAKNKIEDCKELPFRE